MLWLVFACITDKRFASLKFTGSFENLYNYLFLIGYFLTDKMCLRPLAKYRSYYGLIIFRKEFVRFIIQRRLIPLGNLDIENNFLFTMLMVKSSFNLWSISIPWISYKHSLSSSAFFEGDFYYFYFSAWKLRVKNPLFLE